MEPKRRREVLLAGFVVVLGVVLYVAIVGWPFGTSAAPPPTSNGQERTARTGRSGAAGAEAPEVHLEALTGPLFGLGEYRDAIAYAMSAGKLGAVKVAFDLRGLKI